MTKNRLMHNHHFKSTFCRVQYNLSKLFCTIDNDYFKTQKNVNVIYILTHIVLFYNYKSVFSKTKRICITVCFKYSYNMTVARHRNEFKAYKKDRTFQRLSNTRLLYSRIVLIGMCIRRFTVSRKTWRNGNKNAQ